MSGYKIDFKAIYYSCDFDHIYIFIYIYIYIYIYSFIYAKFYVHVTVHRVKFLILKPTRCTNFSNLFLE